MEPRSACYPTKVIVFQLLRQIRDYLPSLVLSF